MSWRKFISVHRTIEVLHVKENFPLKFICDISFGVSFFFFSHIFWLSVLSRECPKITFKFKRRVKNFSCFFLEFICCCFWPTEQFLFSFAVVALLFLFHLIHNFFFRSFKLFSSVCSTFSDYLFGRCHFHPSKSFSMWCHTPKLSVIKIVIFFGSI